LTGKDLGIATHQIVYEHLLCTVKVLEAEAAEARARATGAAIFMVRES
jgi:hypothetical protein